MIHNCRKEIRKMLVGAKTYSDCTLIIINLLIMMTGY